MGRGFPLGRGKGKDGEPKPDLQKLGMKFGGQISITSTGNQAKKSDRGNDGQVFKASTSLSSRFLTFSRFLHC